MDGLSLQDLLGASGNPNQAIQAGLAQYLGNQQAQQQIAANQQAMQMQADAQQRALQAQQAWQQDVGSFIQNPSAEGASNLTLRHPDQAKAIQQSWQTRDAAVQASDKQGLATVYSYIENGQPDQAKAYLQQRLYADKAAGKSEPMVEHLLGSFDQDSTGAHAKGMSAMLLALAPGGEEFAKTLAALNPDKTQKGQIVGRAIGHYEGGKWVTDYRDPEATEYKTIKNADGTESIVQIPGVGGSASAPPVSGRTTGGWTPAIENGGDNPRPVVDAKIAGAAKYLGVDLHADISQMSPMQIAQAMTLSEGGKGTLADRNNNPANLRNGDGSYKQFPTKQAGLNAAAALVARKLKNGQTTVASLIEGLPVGGTGGSAGGARVVATSKGGDPESGGPDITGDQYLATLPFQRQQTIKAIAEGRATPPKPGTKFGQAILEQVAQYDPTFDAANAQSRMKTRADFTSGKSAVAVNALNTAMGHLIHLDDQAHDLGNSSFMPGIVNPIWNTVREKVGNNTELPSFDQTKQAAASEMRKVFAGSGGGNLAELQAWEKTLDSSKSYEQLHAAIRNGVTLMGSRLDALKDQYATGMGRSDQAPQFLKPSLARDAAKRFGVDLGAGQQAAPQAQKAAPANAPPAGVTRAARNPKTGQMLYLVNGKWVAG